MLYVGFQAVKVIISAPPYPNNTVIYPTRAFTFPLHSNTPCVLYFALYKKKTYNGRDPIYQNTNSFITFLP